jgi:peptide-methionine (R)-S-oxide reductase
MARRVPNDRPRKAGPGDPGRRCSAVDGNGAADEIALTNRAPFHRVAASSWRAPPPWRSFDAPRSEPAMTDFDLTPPSPEQRQARIAELSPEERRVLLEHGTEAAFCGVFTDNKLDGTYTCRLCGLPLFRSSAKFDSGTGWPSFFAPFDPAHLRTVRDSSYGMVRTEITCARCGSHLGHVFPDGPPPTRERHCLNSVALGFTRTGDPLPDALGRGGIEAAPVAD